MDRCFDKLGQEIVAGSAIVYGHALGRCAGVAQAVERAGLEVA